MTLHVEDLEVWKRREIYCSCVELIRVINFGIGATYINSEILQTFKLAQVYLQFRVNLQGFGFGVLEESPELLQSVKLT